MTKDANAFVTLMNSRRSSNKKRLSTSVACPAGCGRHVWMDQVNHHLDKQCSMMKKKKSSTKQGSSSTKGEENNETRENNETSDMMHVEEKEERGSNVANDVKPAAVPVENTMTQAALAEDDGDKKQPALTPTQSAPASPTQNVASLAETNTTETEESSMRKEVSNTKQQALTQTNTTEIEEESSTRKEASDTKQQALTQTNTTEIEEQSSTRKEASNTNEQASKMTEASNTIMEEEEDSNPPLQEGNKKESPTSVFSQMMNQAKIMASKPAISENHRPNVCLYLNDNDWTVSVGTHTSVGDQDYFVPIPTSQTHVANTYAMVRPIMAWSAMVRLRCGDGTTLPLTVATSAQPSTERRRWVQRHSRLSVPVLKSMWQKATRRRRPLPAVRMAMELADKSLSDLLRRLPVIILEDSTLHPETPLLLWWLMAESKDYTLPDRHMVRLFEIVYQVVACPWSDELVENTTTMDDDPAEQDANSLSLAKLWSPESLSNRSKQNQHHAVLVGSLLIRASYGGMACDVRMLHRYARRWHDRLASTHNDGKQAPPLAQGDTIAKNPDTHHDWSQVLPSIFGVSTPLGKQSRECVAALGASLPYLTLSDVCLEGVDFHCSNILSWLQKDEDLMDLCHDLVALSSFSSQTNPNDNVYHATNLVPPTPAQLEDVLRQCLWNHSAGVNLRLRCLTVDGSNGTVVPLNPKKSPKPYTHFWQELLAPRVKTFQQAYVQERLAG